MALTDNLVSYWKLDESSGNATDSVGSNTLTNTNTVTYVTGKINNGADFGSANTNKRLVTSSDLGIAGTASQSFSFWVNPNALPTSGNEWRIFDHRDAGTGVMNTFRLFNDGGTQKLQWMYSKNGVSDTFVSKTQTLSTGTWYHIVYVYDGTNITGYVNATAETPVAASGTGSGISDGTCIGSTANGFLFGSVIVDEVGYWSRAISSTEVTALYNSGAGIQYPFGTAYSIVAVLGSYAYTGINTTFTKSLGILMSAGSFVLTGVDILFSLARGYTMAIVSGIYTLTGVDVSLSSSIKWVTSRTKSTSSWVGDGKNNTSWNNHTKDTSVWTNQSK